MSKKELSDPQEFESYEEVRRWLAAELEIKVKYDVVYNLVHDKLKASLKVARPKSNEQAIAPQGWSHGDRVIAISKLFGVVPSHI